MPNGKSIRVYLADATVTGMRYAELVNWTGQAVACPRNRLAELPSWPESRKPGVYFLFEARLGDSKPLAYIGESENVTTRLTDHDRKKDFWNEVVIFTSKDENLTKAHVKFLEATLTAAARSADRYELVNSNTPTESSLPRADRDAMVEFVDNVRMVLGTLGYPILEPLLKTVREEGAAHGATAARDGHESVDDLVFKVNNLVARGALTDEGFVIKKGSQVAAVNTDSVPIPIVKRKEVYVAEGILVSEGDHYALSEDVLMTSPSSAASLIAGTARSGPQSWKTALGTSLKDLEALAEPVIVDE